MNNRIRSISIASLKHEKPLEVIPAPAPSSTWLLNEHLQNFPPVNSPPNIILNHGNQLIALLDSYPDLKKDLNLGVVLGKINYLAIGSTEFKALYYKILRYLIINEDSLYLLVQHKLLIFLIITLSTNNSNVEKLQAIKLIHFFLKINNGSNYLSIGVIKSLIYLINESSFKNIIIEIILEISIINPELIYHSNGFNLLIDIVIDNLTSNSTIQLNSLLVIIKLLELNDYKIFFRNGYNLVNLISIFENDFEKVSVSKYQRISFIITVFLKNWNGLISTSINNFKFLTDFINNLRKPNIKLKEFIIDILLDITLVKALPWLRASNIGDMLVKFGAKRFIYQDLNQINYNKQYEPLVHHENQEDEDDVEDDDLDDELVTHYKNHYQGLITSILIKIGIIDLLTLNLGTELNDKVLLLLSNLYKFAKTYLPSEYNIELSNNTDLHSLSKITYYNLQSQSNNHLTNKIPNIPFHPKNIDDLDFKQMITASKVLAVKEFMEWDWRIIEEIFRGPLKFERRFNEVIERQPKFFKRLLSFYRPFKFRFCNLTIKPKLLKKIITIGELMFEIFSNYTNGLKILFKNKILLQMIEILSQIDPFSGISANNPILSYLNLTNTANYGYIKFIGKLTKSNSIKLLNYWQFFQVLNNIVDGSQHTESNNYFLTLLFQEISYHNSRLINLLLRCLMVSNNKLKLKLISLIPQLNLDEKIIVKLVMMNIYDYNINNKLIELIQPTPNILNEILVYNPPLHILENNLKSGDKFIANLISVPNGFKYLHKFNYIDTYFHAWLDQFHSLKIIKFYEYKFNKIFYPYFNTLKPMKYNYFLKKLLDTKQGLNYFQKFNSETNFIGNLINEITEGIELEEPIVNHEPLDNNGENKNHNNHHHSNHRNNDETGFIKLKQNLWVLGEINSLKYGIQLIDLSFLSSLIQDLPKVKSWTIKGLIFYQIGKISLSNEGVEILDENDWITTTPIQFTNSNQFNYTYPSKIEENDLFHVSVSNVVSSVNMINEEIIEDNLLVSEIYRFLSFLSKIEKKSGKELIKLKHESNDWFNYDNFLMVIKIIDLSSYNFSKRNFIFNLFIDNKEILENLIKRKKSDNRIKE